MQGIKLLSLEKFSNLSGDLVVAEFEKNFNFNVKRIFYVTSNHGTVRGKHAHKAHLQYMICINGSCSLKFDNGQEKETILLDRNDIGVEVQAGIWGEQTYLEDNTTLLVLSDSLYDEADYLRNYDDFKKYISTN
jgi:dTDP-4-dehydrorhamnose 3,5-epimerase-like enzyme|tara:strand:- start:2 stop:403 length:402 start_codon:yes stop_codon:yes gene_type:complete